MFFCFGRKGNENYINDIEMKGVKLEFNVCVTETNQFFVVNYALWIKNIIFVFLWIKGRLKEPL